MFNFAVLCAAFIATTAPSYGLSRDLEEFQKEVTARIQGLEEEVNRTFTDIVKEIDLYHTAFIKEIVISGHEELLRVKTFREQYIERASNVRPRAPGKAAAAPANSTAASGKSSVASGKSSAAAPGSECIESAGPVLLRVNDAERVLAKCIMEHLKSAHKAVENMLHAEREFNYKLVEIRHRIRPCVTLHEGIPESEKIIRGCLEQVMKDSGILYSEVLPKIPEHSRSLYDLHHNPEISIEHCSKSLGLEYFDIERRHELHFQFDRCG